MQESGLKLRCRIEPDDVALQGLSEVCVRVAIPFENWGVGRDVEVQAVTTRPAFFWEKAFV